MGSETTTTSDQQLVLTFAELAFLLAADADRAPAAFHRLGLRDLSDDAAIAAAGYSSLVARRLLHVDGDDTAVADARVDGIVDACINATSVVQLGVGPAGTVPDVMTVLTTPTHGVMVRPGGPGSFRFVGLRADVAPGELVGGILAAAPIAEPTAAMVRVERGEHTTSFALRSDLGGRWQGVRTASDGAVDEIDLAGADVTTAVAGLLAEGPAQP